MSVVHADVPVTPRREAARRAKEERLAALRATARALPELPGVYFWKDEGGTILYIGKAINLRARVTSYFSTAHHDSRTRRLISRSHAIEHEVVATELEALFRESALIKREQPEFNRALKHTYPLFYLKLDVTRPDPWIELVREVQDDGALYFGPFRSMRILRETVAYLHDVLPLRKCTRAKPRCRPCIYFQMGTCAAPALGGEHRTRHHEAMSQLFSLLDGMSDDLQRWLEHKRDVLAGSLMFERAAEVQERIESLRELLRRQTILEAAAQSRAVLIRTPDQLLLVAHGEVVSTRPADATVETVTRWVAAHDPLLRQLREQPLTPDAHIVLERWLSRNRRRIRWAVLTDDPAVTPGRIAYVLDGQLDAA